jgi:hypothetical protein
MITNKYYLMTFFLILSKINFFSINKSIGN